MLNNKLLSNSIYTHKLPYYALCLLVLYPILPTAIQSISLALFIILSLFYYRRRIKFNIKKKSLKPYFFICSWVIALAITLIYSNNLEIGLNRLLRIIHLVILPFIFLYAFPNIIQKRFNRISDFFIYTHIFLVFFLLFKCFEGIDKVGFRGEDGQWVYNISDQGYFKLLEEFFKMSFARSRYFINENEITTFFIHKAYLSIGFAWCFFLSINRALLGKRKEKKIRYIISAILFLCAIIYFTSIPNLLAIAVLLPLYIMLKLNSFIKKMTFLFICFISMFLILQIKPINDKVFGDGRLITDINESTNLVSSIINGKELEKTNVRYNVWACSYENIVNNFWFGIGFGDEESVLMNCYKRKDCDFCINSDLNTHNYYASILLSGGIFTFILFIFALIFQLWLGFRSKNTLFIILILLFAINLISENMLSRINGILFYAIFSSIMLNQSLNKLKGVKIDF